MPPRVTYWTGTWDPAKEAISKEIEALRAANRPDAPVVAFSSGQQSRWLRSQGVLMFSAGAWPALRAAAAIVERRGQVSHVFGGPASWHLLRALGRRPILLTAVLSGTANEQLPISRVVRVAVESAVSIDEWVRQGIDRSRIEIVRPGVNLEWFAAVPAPSSDRFSLLFASTPSDPREIEPRGIRLLVDLARLRPDIDIVLPWRAWGNVGAARQALDTLAPPPNFIVKIGNEPDMRTHFAGCHATICCFNAGVGKSVPNFVVEGLAAGRPAIVTEDSGMTVDIQAANAGAVAARNAEALAAAVERVRGSLPAFSQRAQTLARQEYDIVRFCARYESIYKELAVTSV